MTDHGPEHIERTETGYRLRCICGDGHPCPATLDVEVYPNQDVVLLAMAPDSEIPFRLSELRQVLTEETSGPEHIGPQPLAGYVMRNYDEAIATLRNSRVSRGLTQLRVARRAGTGRAQLSNYETGKTMPAAPTLFDLAHALGYDLALIPREGA